MHKGLEWAAGRADETGRKPPADFAVDAYGKVPGVFRDISGLVDKAAAHSPLAGGEDVL